LHYYHFIQIIISHFKEDSFFFNNKKINDSTNYYYFILFLTFLSLLKINLNLLKYFVNKVNNFFIHFLIQLFLINFPYYFCFSC
jgi:hypothetical protein